jgi:hypothetical protein
MVRFLVRARDFSFLYSVLSGLGTNPTSCSMCTGGSFPGVNRPECEVDLSFPYSADVNNGGATAPFVFMAWHVIN